MPAEPKKILVIEDEPTIRDICKTVLTDEGFITDVVENGSLGLEALKSSQYDLYLVDIRMPAMGGIEFFELLQKDFPQVINKVVFTTGDLLDMDVLRFIKRSNRPLLPKPFSIGELKIMVAKMLGSASNSAV
jgi:CheY-like chemotaxis protein